MLRCKSSRGALGFPRFVQILPALLVSKLSLIQAAQLILNQAAVQQIQALQAEKASFTQVERKMDSHLVFAYKKSQNKFTASRFVPYLRGVQTNLAGTILVDIAADVTPSLLGRIQESGGKIVNSFSQYGSIRASVPLARTETIASFTDVRFIRPAVKRTLNSVTSEGVAAHSADFAHNSLHVTGKNVKVGVISDSVDYLSQAQEMHALGNVTVAPQQSGIPATGEGTAMLEIVHALAPESELYFATADGGPAQFAANILDLRVNFGCDIIVDDITYSDESPFQDGVIARAVNTVTSNGALYFSSAANSGNLDSRTSGTWEGDFSNGGAAPPPVNGKGGFIHSFVPNLTFNTVLQSGISDTVLFWSDPLGASTNDYDLYVLDPTGVNVVNSSINYQNGTQDPYESVSAPAPGERIVVVLAAGTNRFLHLDTNRGQLAIGTTGSTRGHNASTNAFCVAAVDVHTTVPFPSAFRGGPQNPVEAFSSDGPRRMFFYPDSQPMTPGDYSSHGGLLFAKPDLAAADGVTTTLPATSGLNPFFGTSAAAPHAAAIAALLKSFNNKLTPSEIREILTTTALDIMGPGKDWDSGAGIVMADKALQSPKAKP